MATAYFYMAELMPKFQTYYDEKYGNSKNFTDDFTNWSPEEKIYMQDFMCANMDVTYIEQQYFDINGADHIKLQWVHWKCQI